jgi:hypothetical protein
MRRPFKSKGIVWLLNGWRWLIILALIASGSHLFAQAGLASHRQGIELVKAADIREAERRLSGLGYWTGPVDDRFDAGSRHALIAFQKVEGRKRTGKLTMEEMEALRAAKRPLARVSGYAHVEIDLFRQVLFIVDSTGEVSKILPVSTGTGDLFTSEGWTRAACTPCGEFTVYRKIAGWRRSPLGLLYYPNYISGGVAIHGSPSVPAQPASHGCIRIPMFAAKEFSQIVPIGMKIIVHDGARAVD